MVLKGHFDHSFLTLPTVVLIECMKKHQRYFPLFANNKLQPSFLVVADNVTPENQATIIAGNQRVLTARLKDALFFFETDQLQPFDAFTQELNRVVFQKNCGSMQDKQVRLASILGYFVKTKLISLNKKTYQRIAHLAKADLVTQMVFEFPSLQGKMGAIYAKLSGELDTVCQALEEQYLPAGSHSTLPQTTAGIGLALADRFDTVVTLFNNGAKPTGSQDPLGLRRAINGVFAILFDKHLPCQLEAGFDACYVLHTTKPQHRDRLLQFVHSRLHTFLIEKGLDYDVAQSIEHLAWNNIQSAFQIGQTLMVFRKSKQSDFKLIVDTATRVKRLASKASSTKVTPAYFQESIEKDAYQTIKAFSTSKNGIPTLDEFTAISNQLTTYFDQILVMAKDKTCQNNRLQFLALCHELFMTTADFEQIVLQS